MAHSYQVSLRETMEAGAKFPDIEGQHHKVDLSITGIDKVAFEGGLMTAARINALSLVSWVSKRKFDKKTVVLVKVGARAQSRIKIFRHYTANVGWAPGWENPIHLLLSFNTCMICQTIPTHGDLLFSMDITKASVLNAINHLLTSGLTIFTIRLDTIHLPLIFRKYEVGVLVTVLPLADVPATNRWVLSAKHCRLLAANEVLIRVAKEVLIRVAKMVKNFCTTIGFTQLYEHDLNGEYNYVTEDDGIQPLEGGDVAMVPHLAPQWPAARCQRLQCLQVRLPSDPQSPSCSAGLYSLSLLEPQTDSDSFSGQRNKAPAASNKYLVLTTQKSSECAQPIGRCRLNIGTGHFDTFRHDYLVSMELMGLITGNREEHGRNPETEPQEFQDKKLANVIQGLLIDAGHQPDTVVQIRNSTSHYGVVLQSVKAFGGVEEDRNPLSSKAGG
ncbi:uncharacterized protein BXZ73DRAFT_83356 [Epithele typhae]|uniref:uncharacterized protein n=1 Tax=Epithele typhae TaxID=378194 RepID=UPI0020082030|nr:uncharacterized protein BXZ73DRAFT_83356 [Epithele typhae]KAH9910641.1 hypothetical protein BXZ73DRAFT_83356 [Epithele typhae]